MVTAASRQRVCWRRGRHGNNEWGCTVVASKWMGRWRCEFSWCGDCVRNDDGGGGWSASKRPKFVWSRYICFIYWPFLFSFRLFSCFIIQSFYQNVKIVMYFFLNQLILCGRFVYLNSVPLIQLLQLLHKGSPTVPLTLPLAPSHC
jgi:hypothetical protein